MYLFYIDESGNTGRRLDTPQQPIHWLAALCVTPHTLRALETQLFGIAGRNFGRAAEHPDFEFHGSDIFQGRGFCQDLRPEQRIALYEDIVATIGHHDCHLFIRGINKDGHARRARANGYTPEHPHRLGFMYLVEKIDEWLGNQQAEPSFFGASDRRVYGLLIADEQKEVHRDIVHGFAQWRRAGTDHGYRTREIRNLLDTVHYVPSQDSWMIQLADCVTYLWNRYSTIQRTRQAGTYAARPSDAVILRMWEEACADRVVSNITWP